MCLVLEFFCYRFHPLLALKSYVTQMMTTKQFTDLRDGKCLKKLSNSISYLHALFHRESNWSQETQEITPGQPINVNDRVVTQIPCLLEHRRNENESDSSYPQLTPAMQWMRYPVSLPKNQWLHELEWRAALGPSVIQFQASPSKLPFHLKLVTNHQKYLSWCVGLGGPRSGIGLNRVLLLSWNIHTNRSSWSLFFSTF